MTLRGDPTRPSLAAKTKVGRNDPCPCGSGKKYKQCCLSKDAAAAPVVAAGPLGEAGVLLKQAATLRASGRAPQAIETYRKALALEPTSLEAMLGLGLALADRGSLDDAADSFRKAIAQHPESSSAHNNLGNALLLKEQYAEAEQSFRRAVALDAGNVAAQGNLGNALSSLGKADEAVDEYRKAIALQPTHAGAHYNLGNAFRSLGRLEEAIASYRRATELARDFADAFNNLGTTLQETGRLEEAEKAFRTALKLTPSFPEAHFNLSTLQVGAGDEKGAVRSLEHAVRLSPRDTALQLYLGTMLEHTGDTVGAERLLKPLAKGTPLDRARVDAWRYMRSVRPAPRLVGSPIDAFRLGLSAARADGLVLEFGVRFAASLRQIAVLAGQPVHGFDSFQGLPEAWHDEARGSYSTKGVLPEVPANVTLHAGWFEETLPRFLAQHAGPVRFVNVDCDLYSSTQPVLSLLAPRVVAGTVIVFDEYVGHEFWRGDEFRAFQEAVAAHGWKYEYLAFSLMTKQAVVRLLAS